MLTKSPLITLYILRHEIAHSYFFLYQRGRLMAVPRHGHSGMCSHCFGCRESLRVSSGDNIKWYYMFLRYSRVTQCCARLTSWDMARFTLEHWGVCMNLAEVFVRYELPENIQEKVLLILEFFREIVLRFLPRQTVVLTYRKPKC